MRHALPAALCCLLASTSARADPPNKSLQLTYSASGPGASTCPDETALHKALLDQLGRDPFRSEAPYRLMVAIKASFNRHGREFTAALQIEDATGRVVWRENRLTTMAPCTTLVLAIGDAVAGWIHERPRASPTSSPAQPPTPPPAPAPTPAPPPSPTVAPFSPPAPPPNPSTRSKLELRMGLDVLVNIGITPSPSIGAGYVFELRPIHPFSIELSMRGSWTPAAPAIRGVPVRTMYASGTIAPCGHVAFVFGCPVFEAGGLRAQGPHGGHVEAVGPVVLAVGARAGAEWPFAKRFSVQAITELKAVPTVTHLMIDRVEAWTTNAIFFSAGFGLTSRL